MHRMRAIALVFIAFAGLHGGEFDQIKLSLARLRKNDPAAVEDIKRQSIPARLIMERVDLVNAHWMVKLLSAEWMLRAHILETKLNPGSESDLVYLNRAWVLGFIASEQSRALTGYAMSTNQSIRRANPDARGRGSRGNDAIQVEEIPSAAQDALTWLCAEIPVRLGDPAKMKLGLDIFHLHPSKDPRTRTFAMMAAWHTGNWALAAELGKALESSPQILSNLHDQAFRDPKSFDYPSLFEWAAKAKPAAYKGELATRKVQVKGYRFRLAAVEGADTVRVAKAKAEAPSDWVDAPPTATAIQVVGAVAHWSMPFGNQLPLSGVLTTDQLLLQGYADEASGRLTEALDLKPDTTRKTFWVGTLTSRTPDGLTYRHDVEVQLD